MEKLLINHEQIKIVNHKGLTTTKAFQPALEDFTKLVSVLKSLNLYDKFYP